MSNATLTGISMNVHRTLPPDSEVRTTLGMRLKPLLDTVGSQDRMNKLRSRALQRRNSHGMHLREGALLGCLGFTVSRSALLLLQE